MSARPCPTTAPLQQNSTFILGLTAHRSVVCYESFSHGLVCLAKAGIEDRLGARWVGPKLGHKPRCTTPAFKLID
jgi:hypothetical protein